MAPSAEPALAALLARLFDPFELNAFLGGQRELREIVDVLPGSRASKAEIVDAAAHALQRRGWIGSPLLEALVRARPGCVADIALFAADLGIPFQLAAPPPPRAVPAPCLAVAPGSAYEPRSHVPLENLEARARACLERPGAPVVLWGPWLSGKTWMIEHILNGLENALLPVRLDPAFLIQSAGPEIDFWRLVAEEIARALDIDPAGIDREWSRPNRGPMRLTRWMEDFPLKLAERSGSLLVLAFDPADGVINSECQDEFFGTLRAWSQRAGRGWPRLRLLLSISTTPAHLVKGVHQSVFVLSDPLALGEWEPADCEALCVRFGFDPSVAAQLESALGRHPYLLATVLHRARLDGADPIRLLDPAADTFDWFLKEYARRMQPLPEELRCAALRLAEKESMILDPALTVRLADIGLARRQPGGRCTLRAGILARLAC